MVVVFLSRRVLYPSNRSSVGCQKWTVLSKAAMHICPYSSRPNFKPPVCCVESCLCKNLVTVRSLKEQCPPHKPRQALESLAREIDRLEADVLDPALCSADTDPAKACSRLESYRHRLSDLQVRSSTAESEFGPPTEMSGPEENMGHMDAIYV